jgi:hypothetical protein
MSLALQTISLSARANTSLVHATDSIDGALLGAAPNWLIKLQPENSITVNRAKTITCIFN